MGSISAGKGAIEELFRCLVDRVRWLRVVAGARAKPTAMRVRGGECAGANPHPRHGVHSLFYELHEQSAQRVLFHILCSSRVSIQVYCARSNMTVINVLAKPSSPFLSLSTLAEYDAGSLELSPHRFS